MCEIKFPGSFITKVRCSSHSSIQQGDAVVIRPGGAPSLFDVQIGSPLNPIHFQLNQVSSDLRWAVRGKDASAQLTLTLTVHRSPQNPHLIYLVGAVEKPVGSIEEGTGVWVSEEGEGPTVDPPSGPY